MSFEIERTHKNESDAQQFVLTHADTINEAGTAILKFITDNSETFYMQSAVPVKIVSEIDGISTNTSYEFLTSNPQKL